MVGTKVRFPLRAPLRIEEARLLSDVEFLLVRSGDLVPEPLVASLVLRVGVALDLLSLGVGHARAGVRDRAELTRVARGHRRVALSGTERVDERARVLNADVVLDEVIDD